MAAGINPNRLIDTPMAPGYRHTYEKGAADVVLDTFIKNGHTTTADALWGGVPVISMMGDVLAQRWAGSLLSSMGVNELITNSFTEYEDLAVSLATSPMLLKSIRKKIEAHRWTNSPFQTIQ